MAGVELGNAVADLNKVAQANADLVAGRPEVIEQLRHLLPADADIRDIAVLDGEPGLLISAARAGVLAGIP